MSAAPASGAAPTAKATTSDNSAETMKDAKPAAALEEDDEFEDFPVESMLPPCCPCCGYTHLHGMNWGAILMMRDGRLDTRRY
jgi:26 proteasome complex subunit DSS1